MSLGYHDQFFRTMIHTRLKLGHSAPLCDVLCLLYAVLISSLPTSRYGIVEETAQTESHMAMFVWLAIIQHSWMWIVSNGGATQGAQDICAQMHNLTLAAIAERQAADEQCLVALSSKGHITKRVLQEVPMLARAAVGQHLIKMQVTVHFSVPYRFLPNVALPGFAEHEVSYALFHAQVC